MTFRPSAFLGRGTVNEVAKLNQNLDNKMKQKIKVTGQNVHTAKLPRFIGNNLIALYVVMRLLSIIVDAISRSQFAPFVA